MNRKVCLTLAVLSVALMLAGCGNMLGSNGEIPGDQIYKITTSQNASNPWQLDITVDIETTKQADMIAALGDDYRAPEDLYVWMAVKSSNSYTPTFYPVDKITLVSGQTSYTTSFNIAEKKYTSGDWSGESFSWLDVNLFDSSYTYDNMSGYYLFISDGYANISTPDSSFSINEQGSLSQSRSFDFASSSYDNVKFPKGQGRSNYIEYSKDNGDAWTDLQVASQGFTAASSTGYTTLYDSDTVTVTYTGSSGDNPYFYLSGSRYTYIDQSWKYDQVNNGDGTYTWTWKLNFKNYTNNAYSTDLSWDGFYITVPCYNYQSVYFYGYTGSSYATWTNSYYYFWY